MHYSTWLSGYKRPYADGPVDLTEVHGGGVIAATFEQLVQVNGWSNLFYGWGGEDDEFGGRTRCVFGEYPIEWGSAALHGDQCAFVHMEDRSSGECPCFVSVFFYPSSCSLFFFLSSFFFSSWRTGGAVSVSGSHSNVDDNAALALRACNKATTDGIFANLHYTVVKAFHRALFTQITVAM